LPTKNEFHKEGTLQFHLSTNNSDLDIRNIKIIKIPERTPKKQTFEDHKKTTWKSRIKEDANTQNEIKLDTELRENKRKP
jgi:hypothetical protein